MKHTRRDYDRIARSIKHALALARKGRNAEGIICLMAQDLADIFAESNGAFRSEQFFIACGIGAEDLLPKEEPHGTAN